MVTGAKTRFGPYMATVDLLPYLTVYYGRIWP